MTRSTPAPTRAAMTVLRSPLVALREVVVSHVDDNQVLRAPDRGPPRYPARSEAPPHMRNTHRRRASGRSSPRAGSRALWRASHAVERPRTAPRRPSRRSGSHAVDTPRRHPRPPALQRGSWSGSRLPTVVGRGRGEGRPSRGPEPWRRGARLRASSGRTLPDHRDNGFSRARPAAHERCRLEQIRVLTVTTPRLVFRLSHTSIPSFARCQASGDFADRVGGCPARASPLAPRHQGSAYRSV